MDNNNYSTRRAALENNDQADILIKLRKKLKDFVILDSEGQFVGNIKDLILDNNRQFNLVISQPSTNQNPGTFLLTRQSIHKVDLANRTFYVDISKSEIERSHKYTLPKIQEISEPSIVSEAMVQETVAPENLEVSAQSTNLDQSEYKAVMPTQPFEANNQTKIEEPGRVESLSTSEVLEEEIIRLLGERLIVDRSKRKIGEIVVRKEIETRMIQVPVRREKLIIEQVGPDYKRIAEIDLGQEEIAGIALPEAASTGTSPGHLDGLTVSGTFNSPKIASLILNAIALERQHGSKQVRVEVVVEDVSRQQLYQEWFDRCSKQQ